jgi:hypothetical protein
LSLHVLLVLFHLSIMQMLGFKVQDADSVLLDLEDVTSDTNVMQNSLSSGFDTDWSLEDLDTELELVLSDDIMCDADPKARSTSANSKTRISESFASVTTCKRTHTHTHRYIL